MDQLLYERPREKLQRNGVSFLTLTELIQLILGSGGAHISSARLAKTIAQLVDTHALSYESLKQIKGVGSAKVSQVLAALEFGRRVSLLPDKASFKHKNELLTEIRQAKYGLVCYFYNGSGENLHTKWYQIQIKDHPSLLAKLIFSDALALAARSVFVGIHLKRDMIIPELHELRLIRTLKDTAMVLQIDILDIYACNKTTSLSWKNET